MNEAVIFDLDDTLISEWSYIKSGFSHIAKLMEEDSQRSEGEIYELLVALFSQSHKRVFNRLLEKMGIDYQDQDISKLVAQYREHTPSICFFDDVLPFLLWMKEKGIRSGIITDGFAEAQRKKLMAVKANDYFDEIVVTAELGDGFSKPHPKAYDLLCEKLHVAPQKMIYVGDNPAKDFHIAVKRPIYCVQIIREDSIYSDARCSDGVQASLLIYSLNELREAIEGGFTSLMWRVD